MRFFIASVSGCKRYQGAVAQNNIILHNLRPIDVNKIIQFPAAGAAVRATNFLLTLAMLAFAANSILCRLALAPGLIDAVSFTSVRLASGAVMLALVLVAKGERLHPAGKIDVVSALALFSYAACFSLAYVTLTAATGAILLFSAIQLTMIGVGVARGERPSVQVWAGAVLAAGGLVYLLAPGVAAPPIGPAMVMMLAGISWGVYSLRGAGRHDPIVATAWNFIAASPLALLFSIVNAGAAHFSLAGIGWALLSGAVTSGLGYVIWYHVLPRFSATTGAIVQLCVPAIAALGGVTLLSEPFSARLAFASIFILGGVGLVIAAHRR